MENGIWVHKYLLFFPFSPFSFSLSLFPYSIFHIPYSISYSAGVSFSKATPCQGTFTPK